MRTKDEIAQEVYGFSYKDLCWLQKKRIDARYHAEKDIEKEGGNE